MCRRPKESSTSPDTPPSCASPPPTPPGSPAISGSEIMTPPIDRIFPCSAHDPSTRPRPPSARGRVRRGRVRRGGSEPFLRIVRRCWSPPRVDRTFRSSSCSVSRCSARRSSTPRRWTNPTTRPSGNLLFSGHEQGRIEIYRTRLHPQARSQVGSHGADSVEYVLVMSGRVTLVVNDVPHLLEAGDTARFSGLSSHYYTTEDSPAVTHTIVGYPRDCPRPGSGPESGRHRFRLNYRWICVDRSPLHRRLWQSGDDRPTGLPRTGGAVLLPGPSDLRTNTTADHGDCRPLLRCDLINFPLFRMGTSRRGRRMYLMAYDQGSVTR
ncbi:MULTISPECIES: cupin domain-containing protein [unclassified Streptomyces]|uniref:cupin domain-containing protein n=2 Tax=Streptomyces TaxID=1883 RepID=UPI002E0EE416|nr:MULTISPECIES: cupin domain-containing protein [unclassified Streptomyces]